MKIRILLFLSCIAANAFGMNEATDTKTVKAEYLSPSQEFKFMLTDEERAPLINLLEGLVKEHKATKKFVVVADHWPKEAPGYYRDNEAGLRKAKKEGALKVPKVRFRWEGDEKQQTLVEPKEGKKALEILKCSEYLILMKFRTIYNFEYDHAKHGKVNMEIDFEHFIDPAILAKDYQTLENPKLAKPAPHPNYIEIEIKGKKLEAQVALEISLDFARTQLHCTLTDLVLNPEAKFPTTKH